MNRKEFIGITLVLGSLTALGSFSTDMYLPVFPLVARSLHSTIEKVSLSLSSYFIGIALGQLIYGPLLDRFGRKRPLYAGLILYALASAGCSLSGSVELLILFRFIQALGSCAAAVGATTLVRDLFPPKENAKVFSILILVLGISPLIAPTVGGLVATAFGWQAIFIILGAIACSLIAGTKFVLPAGAPPDLSSPLKPGAIFRNFLMVLRERQFRTYALCGGISFSGLFAYIGASSRVFMGMYQMSAKNFGMMFALLSGAFIGGSQLNRWLLHRYSSRWIARGGSWAMVFVTLLFLAGALPGWYGMNATIFILFIYLAALGITNPNTTALSLAPFNRNAGTASALLGTITMTAGAIASLIAGLFKAHSSVPMAATMAGASILALMIQLLPQRHQQDQRQGRMQRDQQRRTHDPGSGKESLIQ